MICYSCLKKMNVHNDITIMVRHPSDQFSTTTYCWECKDKI
jgi:hypothetical protein